MNKSKSSSESLLFLVHIESSAQLFEDFRLGPAASLKKHA